MLVSAKMKRAFFDRAAVIQQVDKDTLRFLRNAGGYGRKVARSSMKRKGKARKQPKNMNGRAGQKWQQEVTEQPSSPPGTPPFVHSDDENRSLKKILFAFQSSNKGVVVGPVLLQTARQFAIGAQPVPELLEKGGSQKVQEKMIGGRRWVPLRGRYRPGQPTRTRTAKYSARPFMAPAQQKTKAKFPQLWFSTSGVGQ